MTPVYLVSPSGGLVTVEDTQAPDYVQAGYVPASAEQIKNKQLEEKYSTPGQTALAGLESGASALTFGLSTAAERAVGVPAEAIEQREAQNPVASGLGTAAGVLAPLALTGGASAIAKGASLTAPALIAKAGSAVTKGAAKLLPVGTGAAGRIAAKAASLGAGSAIEGAAYGLGTVVHEAALGDPHLTAQSALGTVGLSALFGGALGVGGGVLGGAVKEFAPKDMGAKLADWLGEFAGERSLKAGGATQQDLQGLTRQKGAVNLNKLGREGQELGLVSPLSTPASTLEKSQALMETAGREMGDVLTEADTALVRKPGAAPQIDGILARARRTILRGLESNPLEQGAANTVAGYLDGYSQKYAQGMTFRDLHEVRRQISDKIYGLRGVENPDSTTLKSALHDLRSLMSDELDAGIQRAGADSKAWKAANRRYEVGATFERIAEHGVARNNGNNLVSPTEFLGLLAGGVGAGPLGGLASGLGTALVRRHGAGALGWAAKTLKRLIEDGAVEGVAGKTAEAIAAERAAGSDTIMAQTFFERQPKPETMMAESLFGPRAASETVGMGDLSADTAARLSAQGQMVPQGVADLSPGAAWKLKAKEMVIPRGEADLSPEATRKLALVRDPISEETLSPQAAGALARQRSLGSPPETVATLALLERMNSRMESKITNGVARVASGKAATVARGEAEAGLASMFGAEHGDSEAGFHRRSEQISTLVQDPQRMLAALAAHTDDLHDHAPNVAQAMQIDSARALSYLYTHLPKPPHMGPLAPKWVPSQAEISKFNRKLEVIQKPTRILSMASAGTLLQSDVDTLGDVYPHILDRMRSAVTSYIGSHDEIPYRSRMMLSMIMGESLDGSMTAQSISTAQKSYAMQNQAAPPAPTGKPSLSVASRSMTNSQASASRGA